jgi:predicted ATPase
MFLVLDNVEQLLPQAAYAVARLLDSPGLTVMATSRERLAVAAEHEYVVPTLVLNEAIALFSARARQLQPAFVADEYVAEIARRLDGLPLALELAASRVKLLTPQQILERLGTSLDLLTTGMRDAPVRQRTLRDTIRWSYELLSEAERKCFEDLASFVGSFGLESAEAVSRCDLDNLQSLVDKSLLRRAAEGRFFLLDTIRAFAEEQLIERGRSDEVAARHAIHFLEVVEAVRPDLRSIGQEQAYVLLATEYPNIRKALTTFTARQEWEHELRLATSLMLFWNDRGMVAEARRWFETGLAVPQPAKLRAAANAAFAGIAFAAGDFDRAEELASATLASASETAEVDPRDRMWAWKTLAAVAREGKNDPVAAERLLREASHLAEQTGDTSFSTDLQDNLAHAAWHRGDYRRAAELFGERLSSLREAGNAMGSAVCLTNIGGLALIEQDEVRAREAFRESAEIVCRLSALAEVPHLLVGLAGTSSPERSRVAATWLGAARKMWRDFGLDISSDKRAQQIFEVSSARIRERLGDAAYTAAFAEGEASDVKDVMPFLQSILAASETEGAAALSTELRGRKSSVEKEGWVSARKNDGLTALRPGVGHWNSAMIRRRLEGHI